MIQIEDKIISLELFKNHFKCDLSRCFGHCCLYGDAGAPLEDREAELLDSKFSVISKFIDKNGVEAIKKYGVWVLDAEGDLVTPLVDGKECAYSVNDKGIVRCGIENAYYAHAVEFNKPISCHLYPIRISKMDKYTALNYHQWHIFNPAVNLGNKDGVPIFRFLKDAIIRRWGDLFFNELENAYKDIVKSGVLYR